MGAAALAAAMGGPPVANTNGLPPPPPPPLAAPPEASGWCRSAGDKQYQVFGALCESSIEALGRKPNDPDDEDVEEFGRALGVQLAIWFPDSALTPLKQVILSGAFIAGEMYVRAEKLPPKIETIVTPSEEPPSPPPPTNGALDADTTQRSIRSHT